MRDGKITFKQKMGNLKRGYLLCHELAPTYIGRHCVSRAAKILSQYAGIYLSGSIVGMIAGERDFAGAVKMVLLYAAVCLFFGILTVLLETSRDTQLTQGFQVNARMLLAKKCADMDYVRVENPETHRRKLEAENYLSGTGSRHLGMGRIFLDTHRLFESVFSILMGIGICFPALFLKTVNSDGFIGFVQSVPAAILLLLIYVILIFTQQKAYGLMQGKLSGFFSDENRHQEERVAKFYFDYTKNRYQRGKDIRIYDQSELLTREWEAHNDIYLNYGKEMSAKCRFEDMYRPLITLILSVLAYAFFIARAVSGMNSASETVILVMSIGKVTNNVLTFLAMVTEYGLAAENIGCIFDFLDIPDEKYKGTIPTEKRDDNEYRFEFCHVSFKYPNSDQYVLQDINLTWRIGEKMALVGRNGSGKSTLVKLLCRLYDPTEGVITLNGVDIRIYNYDEYMALFSVVFQDSRLFSFSLAENVASDTEYDSMLVEECVKRAGLGGRLAEMPKGIETCLYKDFDEQGVEISGGEAQKLCLARAVYKGAPFIVLDEPAAALDPVSEYELYTKFNAIAGTRTAIYISHRLSSCRFCDVITVLENGKIVENGSHGDLLEKRGAYAALWFAQAEYYKDTAGELFA